MNGINSPSHKVKIVLRGKLLKFRSQRVHELIWGCLWYMARKTDGMGTGFSFGVCNRFQVMSHWDPSSSSSSSMLLERRVLLDLLVKQRIDSCLPAASLDSRATLFSHPLCFCLWTAMQFGQFCCYKGLLCFFSVGWVLVLVGWFFFFL